MIPFMYTCYGTLQPGVSYTWFLLMQANPARTNDSTTINIYAYAESRKSLNTYAAKRSGDSIK